MASRAIWMSTVESPCPISVYPLNTKTVPSRSTTSRARPLGHPVDAAVLHRAREAHGAALRARGVRAPLTAMRVSRMPTDFSRRCPVVATSPTPTALRQRYFRGRSPPSPRGGPCSPPWRRPPAARRSPASRRTEVVRIRRDRFDIDRRDPVGPAGVPRRALQHLGAHRRVRAASQEPRAHRGDPPFGVTPDGVLEMGCRLGCIRALRAVEGDAYRAPGHPREERGVGLHAHVFFSPEGAAGRREGDGRGFSGIPRYRATWRRSSKIPCPAVQSATPSPFRGPRGRARARRRGARCAGSATCRARRRRSRRGPRPRHRDGSPCGTSESVSGTAAAPPPRGR